MKTNLPGEFWNLHDDEINFQARVFTFKDGRKKCTIKMTKLEFGIQDTPGLLKDTGLIERAHEVNLYISLTPMNLRDIIESALRKGWGVAKR
ncbi:MAG: hypothetical protein ABDK92_00530 [Atribacterota bacterium]